MIEVNYLIIGAVFLSIGLILSWYFEKMYFSPAALFLIIFYIHAYIDPYYRAGFDIHFNTDNLESLTQMVMVSNAALLLGMLSVIVLQFEKPKNYVPIRPVFGKTSFFIASYFTIFLFFALFIVMYKLGLFSEKRGSLSHDGSYASSKAITYFFYSLVPAIWLSFINDSHNSYKNLRKWLVFIILCLAFVYTVSTFGRQFILFIFLTCLIIYHTRVKRFKLKQAFLALLMVLLVTIFALMRKLKTGFLEMNFADIFALFKSGLISFEVIARSIFTAVPGQGVFSNTITLVEQTKDYRYGMTYLESFTTSFIPNTLSGNFEYSTPARWYAQTYAPDISNHGFDFSMMAESYLNFGQYGFIVFFFVGALCAYMSKIIRTTRNPVVLIWASIMIVNLVMSLRNDSTPFFTRAIYFILPLLLLRFVSMKLLRNYAANN